jgi:DNA-3-methyladenine glycosylase
MKSVLKEAFFDRDTPDVARDLLGKFLVRRIGGKTIAYMITETEAYDGFKDKGSHAHRGETVRNKPMFGPAGYWYVYFTYGIHWMLNVTTREEKYPAAVLIRGIEGVSGPARLTKFLKIDGTLSGERATRKSGLWIEDRGLRLDPKEIKKGPRVGIDYAGPHWAARHWRFWVVLSSTGGARRRA